MICKKKGVVTEKNIAVISAGYWGKNLVRNFHQLGALKTICDAEDNIRKNDKSLSGYCNYRQ